MQRLNLHGHFTAAERLRLLEVAESCPVHRTLATAPLVITRYEEDGPV